jgi:hypothetical protein
MPEMTRPHAPTPNAGSPKGSGHGRAGWLVLNLAVTVSLSAAIVWFAGKGLRVPHTEMIDNFARYENIRLPAGARSTRTLKSFTIRTKSIDDFGRVYVNNRMVTSNDIPQQPFELIAWADDKENYKTRFAVDRADPTAPEVDVRRWLRSGVNWIMVELENSRWGACTMGVEFLANGNQLENSPYFIPEHEQFDTALSNPHLVDRFRALAIETAERKEFGIVPEADAICARIIFGFVLD